ncbi:kinase-like protein [Fistulina hepatica ATCC 64428]|uniref:Kinase-like protein n=1 Tax=Fistulina hepatica ATCC 64428 TaxID=1128425 RepID=A0A0D7APL6_9AGAR|nr:kinase-like protein [Fistulina hepatica ATCC 64428]
MSDPLSIVFPPRSPRTKNSQEKDLVWKFRFYLTKYLKSTEIDIDDAPELLGPKTIDSRVRAFAVRQLARADDDALKFESAASDQRSSRAATTAASYEDSGMMDFLINWGVKNHILGNRLYWYLMVMAKMYGRIVLMFLSKIMKASDGTERRELICRQGLLVEQKELRTSKDLRPKKIEKLRAILSDSKSIVPEKSSVFKSNLYPLLLYLRCTDGSEYPIIFKDGGDMRQDQLVIQLFTLMDRLLRQENLDLKLIPYDAPATGPLQGMAQFIPSKTIAAIVSEHGTVLNYLRAHYPDDGSVGTSGVDPTVIDTFVRSCVDFGYILGRDPKPFPPPVKVCKEMVDGMGGAQSPHYMRFRSLCFAAFSVLRKSANLILNLVELTKFRLDLTEEEAIKHFETLLNETSYFTVVLDRIHDLAQYWRS